MQRVPLNMAVLCDRGEATGSIFHRCYSPPPQALSPLPPQEHVPKTIYLYCSVLEASVCLRGQPLTPALGLSHTQARICNPTRRSSRWSRADVRSLLWIPLSPAPPTARATQEASSLDDFHYRCRTDWLVPCYPATAVAPSPSRLQTMRSRTGSTRPASTVSPARLPSTASTAVTESARSR